MNRFAGLRNGLTLIVGLLLLWQLLYLWTGDVALASPLQTFRYTAKLFAEDAFDLQVYETLRAFAIAYALSVVIGLAVGFWLGFDRLSGDALEPMIVSVYAVPKLTLYPILLLAFGLRSPPRSRSASSTA
jgi:NitT/TauT family transport system permease protein